MDKIHLDPDDVAWEESDKCFKAWKKRLYADGVAHQAALLIMKHAKQTGESLFKPFCGSYNACLRLKFAGSGSALIRFAVGGRVMFLEEKIGTEAAAMRFVADQTTIPIPLLLHAGMSDESPNGLGPFLIMEYAESDHDLCDALNSPGRSEDERPLLDPNISEEDLGVAYGKMAWILLQLSLPSLPRIGSFAETGEFEWSVTERPMTYNSNLVTRLGDFPIDRLPKSTFETASSYYSALADMHLEHLSAQHNDAIENEVDCRRKYVARHLFRKLASEGRLDHFPQFENGPFKLSCPDLRPTNVLMTKNNNIVGVVDWEFTIAGPAGFAFSPPWWLLLERPNEWPEGMDDWAKLYPKRLESFLRALEAVEKDAIDRGTLRNDQIISNKMRESWESGAFWVDYAAQDSFAFDQIYFSRLDERFFGKVDGGSDWLTERLALLTEEQRLDMEPFVKRKMAQKADRRLADGRFDAFRTAFDHPDDGAKELKD